MILDSHRAHGRQPIALSQLLHLIDILGTYDSAITSFYSAYADPLPRNTVSAATQAPTPIAADPILIQLALITQELAQLKSLQNTVHSAAATTITTSSDRGPRSDRGRGPNNRQHRTHDR